MRRCAIPPYAPRLGRTVGTVVRRRRIVDVFVVVVVVEGGRSRTTIREEECARTMRDRTDPIEETAYLMMRDTHPDDASNLVVQLCGNDPLRLGLATRAVLEIYSGVVGENAKDCNDNDEGMGRVVGGGGTSPIYGIDLNLGCPQECAANGGFGSYLADTDPTLAIECASSMRDAIDDHFDVVAGRRTWANRDHRGTFDDDGAVSREDDVPPRLPLLSAKIRLSENGIDDTVNFVLGLYRAGVDYVTVHCRRRMDKHLGPPDWESGRRIVDAI